MSAFMQDAEHIRVLLWAALAVRRHAGEDDLYWYCPDDVEPGQDLSSGLDMVGSRDFGYKAVRRVTRDSRDYIGQLLVDENARSVTHRYKGDTMGDNRFAFEYGRGPQDTYWTDREVMLAIRGYRYQASEHPGWATSEAKSFIDALEHRLISRWLRQIETTAWSIVPESRSEAGAHAEAVRNLGR